MGTADKNAQVVRRGYEAFNTADMAVLTETEGTFKEMRDGKVISGTEYFYDLHAWDEFWSYARTSQAPSAASQAATGYG